MLILRKTWYYQSCWILSFRNNNYVYALYKFTRKLNEDACNCLTQGKREAYNLLYIYSYVPFLYIFGFIVMTVYLILNQVL